MFNGMKIGVGITGSFCSLSNCLRFLKELKKYPVDIYVFYLRDGNAMEGFMPFWIGEFYAYYQWYYNLPSAEVVKKIPVSFLKKAYTGLHDLELDLAVKKVGVV